MTTETATLPTVRTVQEAAQALYNSLECVQWADGTVTCATTRPYQFGPLQDLAVSLHDCDNWTARMVAYLAEQFADGADVDHIETDGLIDVYHADLCEWAKGHGADVDEALEDFGPSIRMDGAIAMAQDSVLRALAYQMQAALQEYVEEYGTEEDDDDEEEWEDD